MSPPLVLILHPVLYRPVERTARHLPPLALTLMAAAGLGLMPSAARADKNEQIEASTVDSEETKPQNAKLISEAELIRRWLESSPEAKAIRAELGASRFDLVTARLFDNPELGLDGSFLLSGEPPDGRRNFGADLSWRLPLVGERRARIRAAERALDVAEVEAAYRLWLGASAIREAAVAAAFARARLELIDAILDELKGVE